MSILLGASPGTLAWGGEGTPWPMQSPSESGSTAEAWSKLAKRYRGSLEALGVRSGLSVLESEQVASEVLRSARRLEEGVLGTGTGGLRAWLFELARWRIADRLRRTAAAEALLEGDFGISRANGGGAERRGRLGWVGRGENGREAMEFALYRVARASSARDFQVFELAQKQGWGVLRISRVLGIHPFVVWMIKARLSRQLRRELVRLKGCWA